MHLVHSEQDITDTFTPWHRDTRRITKLFRWLVLMDRAPTDVVGFFAEPLPWQQDYEDMLMRSGSGRAA
jgi:hypothetical protein